MDRNTAEQAISALLIERAEAVDALAAAQRRLAAMDKVLEGYRELFPELAGPAYVASEPNEQLGTTEAIQRILRESPGKWFTVALMTREMEKIGWTTDAADRTNTVRTTLARIEASEPHVKRDVGTSGKLTYSYRPFEDGAENEQPPHHEG